MSRTFEVHFTLTLPEYLRVNRPLTWRQFRRLLLVLLIPFAFIGGMGFLQRHLSPEQSEGNPWQALLWMWGCVALLIPTLALAYAVLTYFAARRRWQMTAQLHDPQTFRASESGVETRGDSFHHFLGWDHIAHAESKGDMILLMTVHSTYFLIPTRAFPDSGELDAFKDFVRTRVADCRRLS